MKSVRISLDEFKTSLVQSVHVQFAQERVSFAECLAPLKQELQKLLVGQTKILSSMAASSASTHAIIDLFRVRRRADFAFHIPAEMANRLWCTYTTAVEADAAIASDWHMVANRHRTLDENCVQRAVSHMVRWLLVQSPHGLAPAVVFRDTHEALGPTCPALRPDLSFVLPESVSALPHVNVSWLHLVFVGELKRSLVGHGQHEAEVQVYDNAVHMMTFQSGRQFVTSFTSDGSRIEFWKIEQGNLVSLLGDSILWPQARPLPAAPPPGFVMLLDFLFAPLEHHGFQRIVEPVLSASLVANFPPQQIVLRRRGDDIRPHVFSTQVRLHVSLTWHSTFFISFFILVSLPPPFSRPWLSNCFSTTLHFSTTKLFVRVSEGDRTAMITYPPSSTFFRRNARLS
jgi:hypothetical protein